MYRWLAAVTALALVAGCRAGNDERIEGDKQDDVPQGTWVPDPGPTSLCPPDWCQPWPLPPMPGIDYPIETPPDILATVNGTEIPLPKGGGHAGLGPISDPGGPSYMYTKGQSFITFTPQGWIWVIYVAPGEEAYLEDFRPTFDALFNAANPIQVAGKSLRIPWGATYGGMLDSNEIGVFVALHELSRGNTKISVDKEGNIVEEQIAPEDAADFQPVIDALRK